MIEIIRDWVVNIVSVIMLLVLIEIMIPSEKFKKYVSFVTGLLLMIVIINPIVKFSHKDVMLEDLTLQTSNMFDKSDIERNYENFNDFQNNQIVNEYKSKLTEQIVNRILSIEGIKDTDVDIKIEEDVKSKSFGTVYNIDASVSVEEKEPSNGIKKVSISLDKPKLENNDQLINKIKDTLEQVYQIPKEKILITLVK